jgi:phenylalanine-4-hydroxylase
VLFDPLVAFRVPYRIDMLQFIYFVINDYQQLYDFLSLDMEELIQRAHKLGEYPPFFMVDEGNPNIHIHAL